MKALLLLFHVSLAFAYRFPDINPPGEDPLDIGRLEAIHSLVKEWPSEEAFDHLTDLEDALQPVKLTAADYQEMFFGPNKTKERWLIVFLKTFRSK